MSIKFNPTLSNDLNKPLDSLHGDIASGAVSGNGSGTLAGIGFSLSASATAEVESFSAASTQDEDGIIGQPVQDDSKKVVLQPQILYTNDKAWLKYRFEADFDVSAQATGSFVGFKIDNSYKAVFTDIHVHSPHDQGTTAITQDVPELRFTADPGALAELKPNEAISYEVRGELSASVTLSWSDIFSSNLAALSQLLKSTKMLAIQVTLGASVSLDVGLIDDFIVVFSGQQNGQVRVAVKKSKSRSIDVTADVGAKAQISDASALEDAVNQILKSIIGQPEAIVDAILAKASLDDLSASEKDIINYIAQEFGWAQTVMQTIAGIRQQWNTLKGDVSNAIKEIAETKVSAGFSYEYSRVKLEDTLLEAIFDVPTAQTFHNDLMLCDVRGIVHYLASNPGDVINYLNQQTITRQQAWGFTLGIGAWKLGGKDQRTLTSTIQTDITGNNLRIAFDGVRSYSDQVGSSTDTWLSDFNAAMPGFAAAPTAADFKYGLHFHFDWTFVLDEDSLRQRLDYAVLWQAIGLGGPIQDVQTIVDKYRPLFGKATQLAVDLTINDGELRQLLPTTDAPDKDRAAAALASAMPYWSDFRSRLYPEARQLCYQGAWKSYLNNPDGDLIEDYARTAAQNINNVASQYPTLLPDADLLAERELDASLENIDTLDLETFAGQIHADGLTADDDYSGISQDWQNFWNGLRTLNKAVETQPAGPYTVINDVFGKVSQFWDQSLYVRAVGAYLVTLAADKNILNKIERTVTITVQGQAPTTFTAVV